ncbi:MAG: tandem-95 repeat protein [Planctomycetota bacterium]|nr:MAG: tandem-95 repeat protein [Planctomycetota bacterium]
MSGTGGSISPSGAVVVDDGASQTFTITANPGGYAIAEVLVDGVSQPAAINSGSYTFSANDANHTITASFSFNITPPDLTAPGAIAAIKARTDVPRYDNAYNLGSTGLRGWVHQDGSGSWVGKITDPSRQILVTVASTPGSAVVAVDDVILGAVAASSGTVPSFTSDARKAFGAAITDAEKTGAGTLRVKRWRAGVTTEVNIPITTLGTYSATAPYSCPKSSAILANTRNQMVGKLLADANYLGGGHAGAINALALLASIEPGHPNYAAVQTHLQTYARSITTPIGNNYTWASAYQLIFLSEYYLLTNDSQVVPVINSSTVRLAKGQGMFGTFGHGLGSPHPDGSGQKIIAWYGPVNCAGNAANLAIVLGKKALQAASQPIDPAIDAAIVRSSGFMGSHINKGAMQYGEHFPNAGSYASNSKDATAAVFFGLQSDKTAQTEYFARMSISSWIGGELGHTGQGWGSLWNALGAGMGGEAAASGHFKQLLWRYDIHRRTDGSFTYDTEQGSNDYFGGKTADGTYLGETTDYGVRGTSLYLLTYSLPLKRLYITGKNLNTAYNHDLDATKVAHAVSAASYALDRTGQSIAQLFTALGDYDPHVRHFASLELASRSLTGSDLTNLRNLLNDTNPNLRGSAAQALGYLQDSTALPALVARLSDADHWVRQKAANAIRYYANSAAVSAYRDVMLEAFIANGPAVPDTIDWSDPLQFSNGQLGQLLFGDTDGDGAIFPRYSIEASTVNAPKATHLYPALRIALLLPSGRNRGSATNFVKNYLSPADAQALFPEMVQVQSDLAPGDTMFGGGARSTAMDFLAATKVKEGIPLALSMLVEGYSSLSNSATGDAESALSALASYGDMARYTLPTLRGYLATWDPQSAQYSTLLSTIATIDNAITAPPTIPGLCVANSQAVATTGAKAITLTGASPRGAFSFLNVTQPANGTLTGTAPNLTYTPNAGYSGMDKFTFRTKDSLTTSDPATVSIIVGSAAGTGIVGAYFNNSDFTSPVLTRTDPQINFDWGTGSPAGSIGADTFSARWDGLLRVPETGTYTFSTLNSDGARLYINGQMVIDDFVDQTTNWTDSTPINLTAGQLVDLQMFHYENTGSAVAKLKWTGPSIAGASGDIIGSPWLYDGAGTTLTPYAHAQTVTLLKDTSTPITLTGSGGTLTYAIVTPPAQGTLSGTAPNLTYTPPAGFSGSVSFTFRVNNGTSNSAPATVSINVQSGNLSSFTWASAVSGNWSDGTKWTPGLPATAGLAHYALNFTNSGTYTATHNLSNGFQLNQLNTAANVTLDGTNSISFVANGGSLPQFNHNGPDAVTVGLPLTLQAMTSVGGTGTINLTGTISGSGGIVKNSLGTLTIDQNNTYTGGTIINAGTLRMEWDRNSALGTGTITLNGGTLGGSRNTVANPIIANGGKIQFESGWGTTLNGPITLNGDLTLVGIYVEVLNLNGNISGAGGLNVKPVRQSGFSPWAGVSLAGTNTYTGKTTVRDSITLICNQAAALGSGALEISNSARVNLNFTGTKTVASLTLDGTIMPPGTYGSSASPATNKNDTYFYGTGTVTVTNNPPVASPQSVSTAEDTQKAITLTGTDANGSPLTYSIVSYPANGTLSGTAPNVTYIPAADYHGADSFTFRVNDGTTNSNVATVSITVTPVDNDPPVFAANPIIFGGAFEETAYTGQTLAGWASDPDAGATITYSKVSGPAWLAIASDGTLSGTPEFGASGLDSFVVRATDNTSLTTEATLQITVWPYVLTGSGSISREVWTGIAGTSVSAIPLGSAPNISDTLTSFEGPSNWADNYGTRIRGYLTAPSTGSYIFWIASDDGSELWLSTDIQPANKIKIAEVTSWTPSRQWNQFASQKSVAINLTAGLRYYVEALQKEGGGGDNVAVGWAKPGESTASPSEVIPGGQLSPFDPDPPTIASLNPADNATGVAVGVNLVATFSENIVRGTGNITVRNMSASQDATIAVTDTTQVSISGNVLTINPTVDLLSGTNYAIQIAANCVQDTSGNNFAGYTSNTIWNFTTAPDTTAPTPDPMSFATPPTALGQTSITMTATTASDPSGVEYFFECTAGGGHSSAWQDSPIYTDTGLTAATQYSYKVRARDKSAAQTATAWSATASATTPNTPYGTWSGGAAFADDANNDGVDNGMAWLLGAEDPSENAAGKLPKATRNGNNLRLTFRCLKSTMRGGVVLKVQTSADLGLTDPWTNHETAVPDADGTVNGVVFDTTDDGDYVNVVADIPAPGSGLFARLSGLVTP